MSGWPFPSRPSVTAAAAAVASPQSLPQNPVQAIRRAAEPGLAAAKLLGAGGGGYLLLFAHDEDAARRIRHTLTAQPPNDRARFVDFRVSPTGLQVTRS